MPDDPHTAAPDHDVEGYVDSHRESFVDDLITWCKIPSISSSPDHTKEVRSCAEHLRDHLAQRGATSTAILETTGHPAVFAEWLGSAGKHAERLKSDYVVVSDTAMFGRGIPSLCVGLRGIAYFDVTITAHGTDLHSGSFGGAVANPALALARILAALHDENGHVTIAGF